MARLAARKISRKRLPRISEKKFIESFGMTSDELSKMMTLTPPNRSFNIPEKEFTESFGMTPDDVAQKTGIPKSRLDRMIAEVARKMKCSPAIALKQAKYFGIHDSLLLNLTVKYNKGKLDN